MPTSFIETVALWKSFQMGREVVHALAGVDLTVERGAFLAVMGPSGSGKSTLMYLIGGLDRPTNGRIIVDGQEVETMDENTLATYRRHTVGFIFQSFNLIPTLTAVENVAFPMRFGGVSRRERREKAKELLARVGLESRMEHRPTELSGGQQQRVAIARALVNDPHLILADEPTGNLDTASGTSILELLAELNQGNRTILVVTHDPRITQFATHTAQMLDGRIVEHGVIALESDAAAD
jgi:putative ABC transport system ATP-binding protein